MRHLILGAITALACLCASSTAHAGLVSRDARGVVFTADTGEGNDLTMRWIRSGPVPCEDNSAACVTVSDAGAPLTFGEVAPGGVGCSLIPDGAACAAWSATAYLGDQDDRALVSVNSTATIWGGTGNDHIGARGEAGAANAYGEAGDDQVSADGEGGTADGGPGNDVVSAFWNVETLSGGAGDDELHFRSWIALDGTVDGGSGDDRIFGWAARARVSVTAGPGADYVLIEPMRPGSSGSGWDVDTGRGDDTVHAGPGGDSINAGYGADSIDVAGGATDTVTCGNGRDEVRADADDILADDCEVRLIG